MFYFLRLDEFGCGALIRGELDNLCDGDWMENPCTLSFSDQNKFIDVVKRTLKL